MIYVPRVLLHTLRSLLEEFKSQRVRTTSYFIYTILTHTYCGGAKWDTDLKPPMLRYWLPPQLIISFFAIAVQITISNPTLPSSLFTTPPTRIIYNAPEALFHMPLLTLAPRIAH